MIPLHCIVERIIDSWDIIAKGHSWLGLPSPTKPDSSHHYTNQSPILAPSQQISPPRPSPQARPILHRKSINHLLTHAPTVRTPSRHARRRPERHIIWRKATMKSATASEVFRGTAALVGFPSVSSSPSSAWVGYRYRCKAGRC